MLKIIFTLFILFGISYYNYTSGQINAPPQPCTSGSQNTCNCNNSPLLCSMDVLNGFQYQMTNFLHTADGPGNPMCAGGTGTTAHNPTWFRFLAWCEDIDLLVNASNCNHPSGFCGSRGIQLAVFPECNWQNPNNSVACEVNDCLNSPPWNQNITLSMTGLTIGQTYSLVVDGCCNSACLVTISVTSPPCPPEIAPWPGPIMGETNVCVGSTHDYEVEVPDGGLEFAWYVNTFQQGDATKFNGTDPTTIKTLTWDMVGTYQLCVDTRNACVLYSDPPSQNCITVNVYDAEAGNITALPTPTCPTNNVNINVTGNNTDSDISQYIVIADASGTIVQVTPGVTDVFTWPTCGVFTAYSYNYVTALGNPPVVGDNISTIQTECTSNTTCCELEPVTFEFADTSPPVISGVPLPLTVNCFIDIPPMPELPFNDNCLGTGMVMGVQVDDYTNCDGGTITRTWTVTDSCGNFDEKVQTITINPVPEAVFTPFADITVSCAMFPPETLMPQLVYNNGLTGTCAIAGSIIPVRTVDTMNCMGTVTYTWMVEDICMRTIFDEQIYTVEPPLEATFINPPADVTVACTAFPADNFLPPLQFSNGETGVCQVMGQIIPYQTLDTANCEGTVTFTWEGNDRCGRPLFHEQVWTINPPAAIMFLNVPPDTATITCAQIPAADVLPPLVYSNGEPAGRCRIMGTVIPTRIDAYDICGGQLEYLWEKTDSCGRSISYSQVLFVQPAPEAVWINPPADMTLPCGQTVAADYMPDLFYSNGAVAGSFCDISGSVAPTRVDMIEECEGTVTFTWEVTDMCGRPLAHTQVFTLSPPELPVWVNPPGDRTEESCSGFDFDALPPLSYSNGQTGPGCGIGGSVAPTRDGSVTDCQGSYIYTWEFTDDCNRTITHTRTVTVIPPPAPAFVNPPADITVSCENEPSADAVDLNYTNGGTNMCLIQGFVSATPTVVENPDCSKVYTYMWEFTDFCNRNITHTRVINVDPPLQAQWINPPVSISIASCDVFDFDELPDLAYDNGQTLNGCGISGTVQAVRSGSVTDCQGEYTYMWEFLDDCGRTITHTRTVTVTPPPAPAFVNPPASATVTCENAPDESVQVILSYTNNGVFPCLISGDISSTPTVVENPDCSKVLTYLWEFTDDCDRIISHTQVINVSPPLQAQWINPPSDQTVQSCDNFNFDELPDLAYDNGQTLNGCGISGTVPAVRSGSVTDCQGAYIYTWEFMDDCGRIITHTRTITVIPPPAPAFVNPPPSETLSCTNAPDPSAAIVLNFTNGSSNNNCLIEGDVTSTPTVVENADCSKIYTYLWEFTDDCNRMISHTRTVNVLPPPQATFVNPPANATFTCENAPDLSAPQILTYNNGVTGDCQITGTVEATITSNIVNCQGTHTLVWEFTDPCGRPIQWTQVITVQPPPDAAFVNPPPAVTTVSCENEPDPTVLPLLNVSNNSSGSCLIDAMVEARLNVAENNCTKTYTYTWDYTDFCDRAITYTQVINVLPPPVATFTDAPVYTTMTCDEAELFDAPDINYSNNSTCLISGTLSPVVSKNFTACGGNIQISWTGVDDCNRPISYNQIIVVSPAPNPTIITPIPDDVTVSCQDISSFAIPLEYSNGLDRPCGRGGFIAPVLNAAGITLCGGIATITWSLRDECNFTLNASQSITILPAPQAEFLDLPDPTVTVACTDVPPVPPTLNYSNGEAGFCGINGFATPITTGGFTACGGTIQYTWQFTDACGRPIVYNQNVIVEPADEPFFTSDPDDEFLPCLQGFTPPPALNYTNGLIAPCAISGSVNATTEDLGTTRIYTWTYRNQCTGNEISVDQEVSIRPVPNIIADQTNIEICYGEFFELTDINVTDLNNTNITLTYHTGTPATVFNEIGSTFISTEVFSTYYILATNEFGCTDEVAIRFNNVFGPQAGLGQTVSICNDGRTLNLWNYLTPPFDNTGYWSDTYGTGLNIDNPMAVNFAGQVAGNYPFDYIVPSTNLCPEAVAVIQIELVDPGDYELLEIECSPDFQTYSVKIQIFGYNLTTSAGTIMNSGNIRTISNIPIAQNVTLTLTSTVGDCADETLTLSPPQCNCPVIATPISGGNRRACQNQNGVNLSVTVGAGLTAQWYDALSGGTLLQDQSLTFAPPTTTVGITTYYVQAIDPLNGCFSLRIPVIFEVQPNPNANDVSLEKCDDNTDGIINFDLSLANPLLISGGGFTFSYYLTLADAQSEVNPLTTNYTNTSNNQVIFAVVKNANGCRDIAQVTLITLPVPNVTFTVNNEVCFGNNDGSIFVNPPFAGLEFRLNNLPWGNTGIFEDLTPGNYTVQVRDAESCVASYPLTIAAGQRLNFTTLTLTCNNSGTLSNANDDVYNVVLNVGADPTSSNTFTVRYNSNVIGTYSYGIANNFTLPADGTSGILEVTDNVTGCKITRNVGPLTSCSTDCDISLNNLMVDCDNKGTDADATDDVYTISFTANIVNGGTSTSFTLLINNVISGTYNYGAPVSFQIPASGTAPDIKIRDLLNIQCITNIPVGNLSGCSGACSLSAAVTNIVCNDNGTINDPSDDTFTFTIRVTGFNISDGWNIVGNPTVYAYNTNINLGPYPISGGNLSLNLRDRLDAQCISVAPIIAPPACSTPCVLQVANINVTPCDNNNTGNTGADDKFDVSFVVNVVSGSTNFYNVTFDAQSFGPFTYGQVATINNLPANGQNLTLTVTDAINTGCVQTFTVRQDPCSSCTQTANAGLDIQLTCAQNTATLTGSASVPGGIFVWTGPNGFNKTGQTVTTSAEGTYTLTVTFPDQCVATDMVVVSTDANLPVSNAGPDQELTCIKTTAELTASSNLSSNVTYTWTNAAGAVIGNTQTITVNAIGFYYVEVTNTINNCKSGKDEVEVFNLNQQLTFNTRTWLCDNNDTPSTGDDDEYTITFNLANSTNATNQYRILYLGNEVGVYNYNQNVPIVVPADGNSRTYQFVDLVTGCTTSTEVGPFISCSTNCLIAYTDPIINCDDNNTESIDTDDTYTISFTVSALNGGITNSFNVLIDGTLFNTFTYGSTVNISLPANGNTPFIQLQDVNIGACQEVVTVPALNPCSSTCTISAQVSNILCNDNGTINDPSDDLFFFDINVEGLNTSAGWKVSGSNTVNAYNTRITFGPYPISSGIVVLNLVDNASANCTTSSSVTPPAVCSEPCVITMSGLQILDCDDNNTGTITSDDYFSVRFTINRISGSATNYTVNDGNQTYGPFIYGQVVTIDNLPANGNTITLSVVDPTNTGCTTQFTVTKQSCSSCSQTADAGANQLITCQENVVTLTGTATAGGTFTWTGPGNFDKTGAMVTTSTPGTYYLTVTYPDLCEAIDSLIVNKDANVPDAVAGPDQIINCLVSEVQITGSTSFGGSLNLIWTDINGNQIGTGNTVSVNSPGTYYFEVINTANNCSSGKDEVIVLEDKALPEATIVADPGNLLDCIIGTITLSGKPVADVIFNWQTGESFINNRPSIVISQEGTVTMTAIDTLNGCENQATIEVIDLQDYPILLTTPAEPITCVNNGVFISAGESPEGPNLVFTWLNAANNVIPGETNDSLYVLSPGTYYVILTDTLNGCANRDTFVVDRIGDFPQVTLPADITLYCGVNTTALAASIISPTAPTTLNWSTISGTILSPTNQSNINVQGQGTYVLQVVYPSSGCTTTESVDVMLNEDYPSQMLAAVNDETCMDQNDGSINITAVSGGTPPLTYRLNGNIVNGNAVFSPLEAGNYIVEVTDVNGCRYDTTFTVAAGSDINLFATSPIELVYNQTQIIELITNLQPNEIASIKWTPTDNLSCDTCLVTSLIAKENITYKVEIIDINGCMESVSISIRVRDNVIITTPNIINPESGTNKYFTVYGNESVINIEKLSVFDRWGNLVFIKENFKPNIPTEGWDGTFKGRDVVPGVFVFLVEYMAPSGVKVLTGDVTVMR